MRSHRAMTVAALALISCGGGGYATTSPGGGAGGGGGGGSTSRSISVNDGAFDPTSTTVPVGATITWTWNGTLTHNVTFNNSSITGSGDRNQGETFQKQFSAAGTFGYMCTRHQGMTGQIVVQ